MTLAESLVTVHHLENHQGSGTLLLLAIPGPFGMFLRSMRVLAKRYPSSSQPAVQWYNVG